MARKYGAIMCSIWDDPDFQALSERAQRVYVMLLSQKKMTMVGVLPLTPRSWSRGCNATTTQSVQEGIDELEAESFVIIDEETQELLIRTMVKHDPPKGTKTISAAWRAYSNVDSDEIKAVIHNLMPPESMAHAEAMPKPVDNVKPLQDAPYDDPSDGARVRAHASTFHLLPATGLPSDLPITQSSEITEQGIDQFVERRIEVINHEAIKRLRMREGEPLDSDAAWLRTVRRNLDTDFRATIDHYLAEYPDTSATLIALAAFDGETRGLLHERRVEPSDTSNKLSEYQTNNNEGDAA